MAKVQHNCCEVSQPMMPVEIENRPGLSAIAYRVGTYGGFRQLMLQKIVAATVEADGKTFRPLREWTTRRKDDYGVALIEMWAYLGDILTFYQERIANEAFLRTALLRQSLQRLAAMLDYKPAPGMAATTYLVFTAEEDKQVDIPIGLRVQSVPGQNEKPQKFETIEAIKAFASLNQVRILPEPQPHEPLDAGSIYGTLHPDAAAAIAEELAAGNKLVVFAETDNQLEEKEVVQLEEKEVVALENVDNMPRLTWSPRVNGTGLSAGNMFKWLRKFRLFGLNAPASFLRGEPVSNGSTELRWTTEPPPDFNIAQNVTTLQLDRLYDDLEVGVQILIAGPGLVQFTWVTGVSQGPASLGPLHDTVTEITLNDGLRAAIDLRNIILYELVAPEITFWKYRYPETISGEKIYVRLNELGSALLDQHDLKAPGAFAVKLRDAADLLSKHIKDQLLPDLRNAIDHYSAANPPSESLQIGLIAGLNQLLKGNLLYEAARFSKVVLDEELQTLVGEAFQGEALIRLNRLLLEAAYPDEIATSREFESLQPGRALLLTAEGATPLVVTTTRVSPVDNISDGRHLGLTFTPPLDGSLDSSTAVFYGNVAEATHGETIAGEVLGSGDAGRAFQSFTLKKSPVTFVPDPTAPNGAGNTLAVRVGGVRWDEAATLYGQAPDHQVYTTTINDDAQMTVQFGDGVTGAHLPSGRNNVVATYRQGWGQDGNVQARTLTILLDRPVGLKRVTNPDEAQGGASPEDQEAIQTNAPNTVRTFNRVVSLRDFEDTARQYSGVSKAQATWIWDGEEQIVFLTVAGDAGSAIEGTLKEDLTAYLDARRDPNRAMRLESFQKVPITIEAKIEVNPAYVAEDVKKAAVAAIQDYFAFEHRKLGQSIHLSDMYQVLQKVEGVVAADIDGLQFKRDADQASHGASTDAVQEHLRIFAARIINPQPVVMAAAELAEIEEPTTDIVVNVGTIE